MKTISGGVCAPQGFTACGVHCGIKPNSKKTIWRSSSAKPSAPPRRCTPPIKSRRRRSTSPWSIWRTARPTPWLPTAATPTPARLTAWKTPGACAASAADVLGIQPGDVVVASTGVIGQTIDIAAIERGMPKVASALKEDGSLQAARAIMTTDTRKRNMRCPSKSGRRACAWAASLRALV